MDRSSASYGFLEQPMNIRIVKLYIMQLPWWKRLTFLCRRCSVSLLLLPLREDSPLRRETSQFEMTRLRGEFQISELTRVSAQQICQYFLGYDCQSALAIWQLIPKARDLVTVYITSPRLFRWLPSTQHFI